MESFRTPYGLPNSVEEKLQFTPFWSGPKPGCSDGLRTGTVVSHNFFVLCPILVKFYIRTCLIESFPMTFHMWWFAEEKLYFTPVHTSSHLTPTEAWRTPDSTTSKGRRASSEVLLENCTQVWGLGQIWTACNSRLRKNSASHLFWLVQTCQNLSEPVRNTVTM